MKQLLFGIFFILISPTLTTASTCPEYQNIFLYCDGVTCVEGFEENVKVRSVGSMGCESYTASVESFDTNELNTNLAMKNNTFESGTYKVTIDSWFRGKTIEFIINGLTQGEGKLSSENTLSSLKSVVIREMWYQKIKDAITNTVGITFWILVGMIPSLLLKFKSQSKRFFSGTTAIVNAILILPSLFFVAWFTDYFDSSGRSVLFLTITLFVLAILGLLFKNRPQKNT